VASKLDLQGAYRQWVKRAKARGSHDTAMQQAIGGQFEAFGVVEMQMLRFYGLQPEGMLIDVGCGSGRLAIPLSRHHPGGYLGTDLVDDLAAYARRACARPDWRFEVVSGLTIPASAESADMVCFFSVFTHLLHEQTYLYLEEARRVLKPGGRIVFSFLEFTIPSHWVIFEGTVQDARNANQHPLNVFIDRDGIRRWAEALGLTVVEFRDGDEAFVPLPQPVTLANGDLMAGLGNLGQSICVLARPDA
jgi:SAM-dependent methyltransferase